MIRLREGWKATKSILKSYGDLIGHIVAILVALGLTTGLVLYDDYSEDVYHVLPGQLADVLVSGGDNGVSYHLKFIDPQSKRVSWITFSGDKVAEFQDGGEPRVIRVTSRCGSLRRIEIHRGSKP